MANYQVQTLTNITPTQFRQDGSPIFLRNKEGREITAYWRTVAEFKAFTDAIACWHAQPATDRVRIAKPTRKGPEVYRSPLQRKEMAPAARAQRAVE